jgi:hypothetical protein
MRHLRSLAREREIWVHTAAPAAEGWMEPPFAGTPFVVLVVNTVASLPRAVQNDLADRIVGAGCRWAVCTGHDCSSWDDAIDWACIAVCKEGETTDETFVMTTWHENEAPDDVVFFFLNNTNFDAHDFKRYLLLFVGADSLVEEAVEDSCLRA